MKVTAVPAISAVCTLLLSGLAFSAGGSEQPRQMPAAHSPAAPDDPLFARQWHLRAIGIPDAWALSRGEGAVVAVLDTGIAYKDSGPHLQAPDLASARFVPGWDFVDNDDEPLDEPRPNRPSHGTHIAGTIAQSTGNGLGGAGVAPDVSIMSVRVLNAQGRGTGRAIADGLRFAADHGANVANVSLGSASESPEVAEAVRYAVGRGVTVVVAAGDGVGRPVMFPAAYPEVIAVGAVGKDLGRAPYSSTGPELDLVAPGGDLSGSTGKGDPEGGILQQAVLDSPSGFCFCSIQGTSSAAAHVSGVAALLIGSGRARTPDEVRAALLAGARDLGPPGWDPEYGAGLVDAVAAMNAAPAGMPQMPATDPGRGTAKISPKPTFEWPYSSVMSRSRALERSMGGGRGVGP